jgi:hypothetical protein
MNQRTWWEGAKNFKRKPTPTPLKKERKEKKSGFRVFENGSWGG